MNEAMLPDAAHAQAGLRPVTGLPKPLYSSRIRYAWEDVLATFAAMPAQADGSKLLRYTDPATGAAVTPTMDLYALALGRDETRAKRATHNTVCVVGRGSGTSRVGDTSIQWAKGDVFTVPHWTWVSHKADGDDAVLFQSTDRELINRLGWLREEQAA
jgi:gentisate 1,2-dioxygenase